MFEKLEELAKNNKKISDFHIRSGWPLAFRQTGEIHKVPEVVVKAQDLQDLLSTNCNEVEMKNTAFIISIMHKRAKLSIIFIITAMLG